jgi:hypothetical protein
VVRKQLTTIIVDLDLTFLGQLPLQGYSILTWVIAVHRNVVTMVPELLVIDLPIVPGE